jgi:hypothetical protein
MFVMVNLLHWHSLADGHYFQVFGFDLGRTIGGPVVLGPQAFKVTAQRRLAVAQTAR